MKRMFTSLAGVMLTLTCLPAMAQPAAPQKTVHQLSATQAVEMALKQRAEVLSAQIDINNQEAMNKEITGSALPQVKGSFGITKNFKIPVTVLPDFISPSVYGVLEKEDVRDAQGNPIKFDGIVNTFPAAFGVPWQASLGVSVQQLLFQPDVFVGLKARDGSMELYRNQLKVAEDSVKANVLQAYYGVLIAQKGLAFVSESKQRLLKLFSDQEQLYANGFIEKLDVDKTKVNLNNLTTTESRTSNLVRITYSGLKFALGLPQTDSLVLTDSLTTEFLTQDILSLENDFNYQNRSEIKTIETSNKLLGLQVERYKLQAYPTVAAFWNLQTNAQRQKFDFFAKERWFFANIAGINVSVPLADGWQRRNRVKQAQYALDKNTLNMERFKQAIDLQLVSARTNLTNAIEQLNAQVENKALAERVYNTTKLKYDRGLGSSFELLQSDADLQESLNNYYQSLYNAVIAKINYTRALGKL
ncbi:MAG: TolC family protein [Bacteroidetes bacterium]|uniref:TolC family protein n=1 Tax=Phnomibacter sp. TaxID=2836217 RepID=UPI002FDE27C6|nr:TolC family protein [Bacteroidota bacterium]